MAAIKASVTMEERIKEHFALLGCAQLYDAAPKHGYPVELPMQARTPIKRLAGPVFPVITDNDMLPCLQGLDAAPPGSILYLHNRSEQSEALAGDLLVTAAREQGLAGLVVNGAVRDIDVLQSLDFPVFSTEVTYVSAKTAKAATNAVPCAVPLGELQLEPNDWLFIDSDGMLLVKQPMVRTVYKAAMVLRNREEELRQCLEKGERLSELCGLHDYLNGTAALRFDA